MPPAPAPLAEAAANAAVMLPLPSPERGGSSSVRSSRAAELADTDSGGSGGALAAAVITVGALVAGEFGALPPEFLVVMAPKGMGLSAGAAAADGSWCNTCAVSGAQKVRAAWSTRGVRRAARCESSAAERACSKLSAWFGGKRQEEQQANRMRRGGLERTAVGRTTVVKR